MFTSHLPIWLKPSPLFVLHNLHIWFSWSQINRYWWCSNPIIERFIIEWFYLVPVNVELFWAISNLHVTSSMFCMVFGPLATKACDKKPLDLWLSHNHLQLLLKTSPCPVSCLASQLNYCLSVLKAPIRSSLTQNYHCTFFSVTRRSRSDVRQSVSQWVRDR